MDYSSIPNTLILQEETLYIAIYEECKHLFFDYPEILSEWASNTSASKTFQNLISFFTVSLYQDKPITKKMIREGILNYRDSIIALVVGTTTQSDATNTTANPLNSNNINEILDSQFIYSNAGAEYQMVRDIVTKKKNFKEDTDGILRSPVTDTQGNLRGLAEIKPTMLTEQEKLFEKQEIWFDLIESTVNSLDEMTADLFDLITYLWMVSPKTNNGYITFHSDYALALKQLKKVKVAGKEYDYRKEDRYSIMKRIGALTSIWVLLENNSIQVYNAESQKHEEVEIGSFQKMFDVGKVSIARDPKTGENLGIYALEIKPSELLTPFLDGTKSSLGVLDLKVFQYSHYHQREHKRVIRYLSYQWKIQSIKRNYQPFKVSTLLNIMELSSRYKGAQIRDKFEDVLDDLQKNRIFESWNYTETIDQDKIGKKGWINDYWTKLNITIEPTDMVKQENKKKVDIFNKQLMNIIQNEEAPKSINISDSHDTMIEQQTFNFEEQETIILSPETVKAAIKKNKTNAKKASIEMGVPYSTLLRYLKGESKRSYKDNEEKILKWLKEKS